MRFERSVTSISWLPSQAVQGIVSLPFELGVTRYDLPPPDRIDDLEKMAERGLSVRQPSQCLHRGRERAGGQLGPSRQGHDLGKRGPLRSGPAPIHPPSLSGSPARAISRNAVESPSPRRWEDERRCRPRAGLLALTGFAW